MPKLVLSKIRKLVNLAAMVALVVQTIVPGGLLSWPAGRALADTGNWSFATAGDYTAGNYVSVIDGYAVADLNFAVSSDNMDNTYGGVTDVIETSTSGRVLAAVDTANSFPYSTNYGSTWSVATNLLGDTHYKLTKFTSGVFAGRVLAGGSNSVSGLGAISYTTNAGDNWTAAVTIPNSTKVTAIQTYGDMVLAGTSGGDTGDNAIYFDTNKGGDGPWTTGSVLLVGVTGINDFVINKAGVLALAGISYTPSAGQVPILYSANGTSWTVANTVSGNSSITAVIAMATDPVTGDIYATTNGNYVLKSTNEGSTWSEIAVSNSANAKIIYADANGGIFIVKGTTVWRCLDGGTDFVAQTTEVSGSILAAEGFIRMSNDAYLMGVTDSGSQGDAFTGDFTATITGTDFSISNNTGQEFTSISAVTDAYPSTSEGTDIQYRFRATNSGSWYYWDGSQWSASSGQGQSNQLSGITQANWGRFLTDLGLTSGTFYFQALLGYPNTTVYGLGYDSIALEQVNLTYANTTDDGLPPEILKLDKEPPRSKVGWILKDNQRVPMPADIYTADFTIVAEATDNVAVQSVALYWSKSKGGNYELWGQGIPDTPMPGYWAWYFDTRGADGDGTYYFYSVATDWAKPDNLTEILPKFQGWQYDDTTNVSTQSPYIQTTYPVDGAVGVGIEENIVVNFSRDMDRPTVEANFKLYSGQTGTALDLGWSFNWRRRGSSGLWGKIQSRSVIISHSIPFNTVTNYTAWIDPDPETGAKDVNGMPLSQERVNPDGTAYNPWSFTTAPPQKPDLSNSNKTAVIYDEDNPDLIKDVYAEPGDYLLYNVQIINTDGRVADPTTLVDKIPTNTKYVAGTLQKSINGGVWIQMAPLPQPESSFDVWYEESGDGIVGNGTIKGTGKIVVGMPVAIRFMVKIDKPLTNGTIITNTAEINDGVNPTHFKSVQTVVKSTVSWKAYKEATNSNPNRDPGSAKVGDTLTYTIYLENTGNMDAAGVIVTDRIPTYTTIIGTPTGGLVYDPGTNMLSSEVGIDGWTGIIPAGTNHTFTFQVTVDLQPPDTIGKITNVSYIKDDSGEFSLVKEITIVMPELPLYILSPTVPVGGATSVKLFSPLGMTFSNSVKPETLVYTVSEDGTTGLYYDSSKSADWKATWSANLDGDKDAKVTIQPNRPWRTGHSYTVHVLDATGVNGEKLSKNGDVKDNTWNFTVVRPTLYFTNRSILSLDAGTVSRQITVKLGDWINFDDTASGGERQYKDYAVENPSGVSVRLWSTHETGRFDTDPEGKFDGSIISVLMPKDANTVTFYYTDPVVTYPTFYSIIPYIPEAGYLVYSEEQLVVTTCPGCEESTGDQIYFSTGRQTVPAGDYSAPIRFEIRNQAKELVTIKRGREFLLETTSSTGTFYDQSKIEISQYVTLQGETETKTYYLLTVPADTTQVTFYYQDAVPGDYDISVHDKELKIAADASGPANSGTQSITVVPIDDQELEEEIIAELEEVKDETNRKLDRIEIDPTKTTLLPGGARTFKAVGYDTENKAIKELKFSWYVIGGGGTILKKGLSKDNHSSAFTAGKIPGVYADTVLVAAMYNGDIQAAMASVTITDVVNYGGPGELPSTGPNGIQLLFITLTLLSAVALAAVEHYEKTHFAEGAQPR